MTPEPHDAWLPVPVPPRPAVVHLAAALVLAACAALAGCQTRPSATGAPAWPDDVPEQPFALLDEAIGRGFHIDDLQPRERFLFVGDALTQQMDYVRGFATAVLSLRPRDLPVFFNGGRDGQTTDTVFADLPELLDLSQPTVVYVGLGLHEFDPEAAPPALEQYQRNLGEIVAAIREQRPAVRAIVLMSPPATPEAFANPEDPATHNGRLRAMRDAVRVVAGQHGAGFVDLWTPTYAAYRGAFAVKADLLTYGAHRPTEMGHMVIATALMRQAGVTTQAMARVGWAPLVPQEMTTIRPALALDLPPTGYAASQASRALYLSLRRTDELFFRLWRLAGRSRAVPDRDALSRDLREAWRRVHQTLDGTAPTGDPERDAAR